MRGNSQEMADNICLTELNTDELVTYNPKLAAFTPTTRIAYAKFKNVIKGHPPFNEDDEDNEDKKSPLKPQSTVKIENEKPNGQVVALPYSPKSDHLEPPVAKVEPGSSPKASTPKPSPLPKGQK